MSKISWVVRDLALLNYQMVDDLDMLFKMVIVNDVKLREGRLENPWHPKFTKEIHLELVKQW